MRVLASEFHHLTHPLCPTVADSKHSYGLKGARVIAAALQPVRGFTESHQAAISPLQPVDFFFYIMIPYTAYLLIAEDHPQCTEEEVWSLLEASKTYGWAAFPDDDS